MQRHDENTGVSGSWGQGREEFQKGSLRLFVSLESLSPPLLSTGDTEAQNDSVMYLSWYVVSPESELVGIWLYLCSEPTPLPVWVKWGN